VDPLSKKRPSKEGCACLIAQSIRWGGRQGGWHEETTLTKARPGVGWSCPCHARTARCTCNLYANLAQPPWVCTSAPALHRTCTVIFQEPLLLWPWPSWVWASGKKSPGIVPRLSSHASFDSVCLLPSLTVGQSVSQSVSLTSSLSSSSILPSITAQTCQALLVERVAQSSLTTSLTRLGIPLLDLLSITSLPYPPSPPCRFLAIAASTPNRPTERLATTYYLHT
jgi:hypothetical protein